MAAIITWSILIHCDSRTGYCRGIFTSISMSTDSGVTKGGGRNGPPRDTLQGVTPEGKKLWVNL